METGTVIEQDCSSQKGKRLQCRGEGLFYYIFIYFYIREETGKENKKTRAVFLKNVY